MRNLNRLTTEVWGMLPRRFSVFQVSNENEARNDFIIIIIIMKSFQAT